MADTIRWGIVGAGTRAIAHIAALKATPGSAIVALVDPVAASIAEAQAAIGSPVAAYATPAALAASGAVDAVLVASPHATRREVLAELLDARLDILCEPPLATTLADARAIAAAAAGYPRIFWSGMAGRYLPPAAEFVAQVHRHRMGNLQMLSIRAQRRPPPAPSGKPGQSARDGGGTMVDHCCDFFDLMRVIVESEPVRVFCSGGRDADHPGSGTTSAIDHSFTTVEFANGVRAMLALGVFADAAEDDIEIAAAGDTARLDVSIASAAITHSPQPGSTGTPAVTRAQVATRPGKDHGAAFYQHRAFARAVRGDGPVAVTADDGLRAVAMGVAAETSTREHRVVAMTELGL